MPEGFMLHFHIDKANTLMDRFGFMELEAAEPFPTAGSRTQQCPFPVPISQQAEGLEVTLALQDGNKNGNKKKGNERKTSISSWVDEENPAGLIRVLEDTFQEQHHLGGSVWIWRAASVE